MVSPRMLFRDEALVRSGQEWHCPPIEHHPGETLHVKAEANEWFYLDVCSAEEYAARSKGSGGWRGYAFPPTFLLHRKYEIPREASSIEIVSVVLRIGWGRDDSEVELTIWAEAQGATPRTDFLSPPPKEVTPTFSFGKFYPEKIRPLLRAPSAIKFVQWAIVCGFAGLALLAYYLLEYPVAPRIQQTLATVAEIALVLTTLTLVWATMERMDGNHG